MELTLSMIRWSGTKVGPRLTLKNTAWFPSVLLSYPYLIECERLIESADQRSRTVRCGPELGPRLTLKNAVWFLPVQLSYLYLIECVCELLRGGRAHVALKGDWVDQGGQLGQWRAIIRFEGVFGVGAVLC